MQNEILRPVLDTDEVAVPRYDVVDSTGRVLQQNVELRLKNEVVQQGTPYDAESVLPNTLVQQLGLPASATPADAFAAVIAKSGAKVSMNDPSTADNIAAGYSIGATWIRLPYVLENAVFDTTEAKVKTTACTVSKDKQVFTVSGNGDDKVIKAYTDTSITRSWAYAVVTPDATAVSARVFIGSKSVDVTPGETVAVCLDNDNYGSGFGVEVTFATANAANGSITTFCNATVIAKDAVLANVETGYHDVTAETIFNVIKVNAPFDEFMVATECWQHLKDGIWYYVGLLNYIDRLNTGLGMDYIGARFNRTSHPIDVTPLTDVLFINHFKNSRVDVNTYFTDEYSYVHESNGVTRFYLGTNSVVTRADSLTGCSSLLGKFVYFGSNKATEVYYIPEDAKFYNTTFTDTMGNLYYRLLVDKCTMYSNILTETTLSHYVNGKSPDKFFMDELPQYGYQEIFGRVGSVLHMEEGYYIGTGAYGASNPCKLTFSFWPKLVVIKGDNNLWVRDAPSCAGGTTSWLDGTLTWYSTSNADVQRNTAGKKYSYIALG